ncbi:hypothetical protein O3S81_20265 [Agrobacterium sp. SOY23]|uniref:coiled-coil domain-containing protein n=1 Tax=Agrobacterium sp. SOY23 TaxID=3014555 RepID=UPI0022B02E77|nr:hypothetical protein [Agrobacterium sp. SOY23]MCZ4432048.1 hypothetical protein [Agrobacterium sp. SOY23]
MALSQKQFQEIRSLFVHPDGTLTEAAHRESTEISLNLIRDIVVERLNDASFIDLIPTSMPLGQSSGYLVEDAAGIVEKRLMLVAQRAKKLQKDVDKAVQLEAFPIAAAIAIEVAGTHPNTADLPDGESASDFRNSMRSYLAAKKRWDDKADAAYEPNQLQEDIFQIRAAKRELASQRRALSLLLEEARIRVEAKLTEIDRRSKDIEDGFRTNRELLRDDLSLLQNTASSEAEGRERRFLEFLKSTQSDLSNATTEIVDTYKKEIDKLNANRSHVEERLNERIIGLQDYISRAEDAEARLVALNASISLTEENLAAFKKAAEERAGQSQSRQHWSRRVKINSAGFISSLVLILFFLIIVPVLGVIYSSEILLFLKSVNSEISNELGDSPNAAQVTMAAVNRLLLIGAPVALYFWLVRILVRYNSMALALMDDAHQRRTMIDTYIHLIEHQVARTEDRAILLNAIFRASPGQGSDVEPPSFVDLIDRLKPSS